MLSQEVNLEPARQQILEDTTDLDCSGLIWDIFGSSWSISLPSLWHWVSKSPPIIFVTNPLGPQHILAVGFAPAVLFEQLHQVSLLLDQDFPLPQARVEL